VKEVLGLTSYCLELPPAWTIHNVFHGSLLEPYVEMSEHSENYDEPPPDLVKGEPEYEVEALLGSQRKGRGRKLEYLVRWKGYAPAHDSWEPAANIHAPDLVKAFHKQEPMAIRRVSLEQQESNKPHTSSPMPFHDFCEYPDSINAVREQLRTASLEPSALQYPINSPPPVSPLPDYEWVHIRKDRCEMLLDSPAPNGVGIDTAVLRVSSSEDSIHSKAATNGSIAETEVDKTLPSQADLTYPGPPWFRWQEAH